MSSSPEPRDESRTERGGSIGDFHSHSTCSDGVLAPSALVDLAARRGVRVLALTDHDTLDGIAEAQAAAKRHEIRLVPGVELSCDLPGTELHLLGLFVDPADTTLRSRLREMREARLTRGERIVDALAGLGVAVAWERVREIAGDASVGRPHVARAMIEAGHVATIEEAFDRYLGRNGAAYVSRDRLTPSEAVALVTAAGGLAVMAHPPFTDDYERWAADLAAEGLFGMEVYYRAYPPEQVDHLRALAERLGLFPSGGSDYHGFGREGEREPGDIPLPDHVARELIESARERGCYVTGAQP